MQDENEKARVVLISGGSRGLGAAFVEDFHARGWNVATFSRTPSEMVERLGASPRFLWREVDATDVAASSRFVDEVAARFGRIDALINNAGIAVDGVLPLMTWEDIDRVLAVNLRAAIHLTRASLRVLLRQREGGSIINVSSIIGQRGYSGLSVYSATKAALDGLTRSLAREMGPRGIRVNSVAPGYLETEMSSSLSEEQKKQIIRRTPLGRLGTVDDVTGLVRYLVSPEARFVTGQTIVVDGGITC